MAFATPGNLSLESFGAMLFGRWGCLSEAISELQTQPTKPQRTMRPKGQKRTKGKAMRPCSLNQPKTIMTQTGMLKVFSSWP